MYSMQTNLVQEVQRVLRESLKFGGLYAGASSGTYDAPTDTAVMALFRNQHVPGGLWSSWTGSAGIDRRQIAAGQVICNAEGIDAGEVDGLKGPQTRHAFEVYDAKAAGATDSALNWRDTTDPVPTEVPADLLPKGPTPVWPKQSQVQAYFGAPGSNQVTLAFPYKMRLAWDTSTIVTRTSCHRLVKANFERVFERTLAHYGMDEIRRLRLDLFGGLLNVRRIRGGSSWSMHAYGIACDIDPAHNTLHMGRDRATLDSPEYAPFWRFVYDEGMHSLGKEKNYDWMHFQCASFG